ncbi:MAG: chemotaxis protein CheB [Pseudomonadales bacterium]|nr:chemotaxis protein CheB [Pseudomonadales bacterium]
MSAVNNPKVAVVASTQAQAAALAIAVRSHGYELLATVITDKMSGLEYVSADVWLADLPEDDEKTLNVLLDLGIPILFGIEAAPALNTPLFNLWQRRVYTKLRDTVGEPQVDPGLDALAAAEPPPESLPLPVELMADSGDSLYVCVLAASLGGPAAVKEFLDQLPAGLPVAFVLAQHIDGRMLEILPQVLGRHNEFTLKIAKAGDMPAIGQILIAPVHEEIDFAPDGHVIALGRPWDGPYAPSMDQMLANVSRRFGHRAMAVIFSGMGADGSVSGPQMVKTGGVIFAQTSDSCACSSQPDAMRATACVLASGTPTELASLLVDQLRSVRQHQENVA